MWYLHVIIILGISEAVHTSQLEFTSNEAAEAAEKKLLENMTKARRRSNIITSVFWKGN